MLLKLYDYWRSSASYRLRIAFNLKGVAYQSIPINLHPDQQEQSTEAYRKVNPQMRVPAIELNDEVHGQSMAILEWLEETHPEPALLPVDPVLRLQARAFADTIACDIHPLNNISVLQTLRTDFQADRAAISNWYSDWILRGFAALEAGAKDLPSRQGLLFGDQPTLAEVCLIPQMYNAKRFKVDLSAFPRLVEIDAVCADIQAFKDAVPEAVKP
ncbi:MAG: maleylacetoacetate isomerase [Henriciella sp.]|nr:maleylacetoacetate isomerase [Henriciella sp.]